MKIDGPLVTTDHVRQACEAFDSGTVTPRRPSRTTFLVLGGKVYPGKLIRGLAYRLATGVELDPSRDYSGGHETVRFFERLGFSTGQAPSPPAAIPAPAPDAERAPIAPDEHREPQKRAIARSLRRRFGEVVIEAEFPWLKVPDRGRMDSALGTIYQALESMRGYTGFITPGRSLRCDFFLPGERVIVEYDERQHFTLPRATSLDLYPPDVPLGFDRAEWTAACREIRASDPTPPYRDEQRAFYDSLRDLLAAGNGVRLVRLRHGTRDWTEPGATESLEALLAARDSSSSSTPRHSTVQPIQPPTEGEIRKVALVSHDYNVADSRGLFDYSEHFARINQLCDREGCDTVLYALYTWDDRSPSTRSHDGIFDGLRHVRRVVLEVGLPPDSFDHVEVWQRGVKVPLRVAQRFATSSESGARKQAFLDDLPQRRVEDALMMLCGETNIASLVRGSGDFYDPYHFADRLREMDIRVIFNPVHDYMRRYEMREKRRFYSRGGRAVISVWNQGKGRESALPWTVFHDGVERTDAVREVPRPFVDRPDIRLGVLDLSVR